MRPAGKEPEYEPRIRPPRRLKKSKKRFGIEYRFVGRQWRWTRRKKLWTLWRRYRTETQRDQALHALKTKGPSRHRLVPLYEYRKEPAVKFAPLNDNILVEYDEPKIKTDGGILLPDVCKTPPTKALVLRMGPGKRASNGKLIPMPCEVGDVVLVSVSGIEMENPDPDSKKKVRLVQAEDILGVERE